MSYEKDFLTGLAQMISDSSIAVYRPTGAYAAGERAVVFGGWPQAPDACIVLNYTPVTDGVQVPMGKGILEVHSRGVPGDPFGPSDLAIPVFDLIHNMQNQTFGTSHVIQILRDHVAPLEQDAVKRFRRVDIYYADLDAPGTPNRPSAGY